MLHSRNTDITRNVCKKQCLVSGGTGEAGEGMGNERQGGKLLFI